MPRQVMRRHDFLPFGEELSAQIPPADRRLFTGQERDVETGLDYFHARQLRVDLGRFTTPDPMADLAWTDPTLGATNAYGYVGGNPLGFTDPSGACWICELFHVAHQAWDALTGTSNAPTIGTDGVPTFRSGVVVTGPPDVAVPMGGLRGAPPVAVGSPGLAEPADKASQSQDQTKKKIACTADALLNFGASTLIPGYAAVKTILGALDVNVNPVQTLLGYNQPMTATPTAPSMAAGGASMNWLYREAVFDAAGGATKLDRLQALASRAFSGAANSAKYGAEISALEGLSRAASLAGRLTGVLSAVSSAFDVYGCWAGK